MTSCATTELSAATDDAASSTFTTAVCVKVTAFCSAS